MKTLKLICLAFCIIALSACRDNRTQPDRMEDSTNRIDNTDRTDRTTTNQATGSDAELAQMYGYLNMNQEQIDAYERMERDFRSQSSTTDNQEQTLRDRERRRDQYLREILNDEQYLRYEQWKRNNPGN